MRDTYEDNSYIVKEIWCGADGRRVFGKLFIPNEASEGKKVPLVLFCPELYKTHESGVPYAKELAGRGIAVMTFDCRGASQESRSPGSMQDMSVMTCAEDIFTVYEEVKNREFVDPGKTAAIGASQGAFATAVAASRRPDVFSCIVLMYGAYVILDDVRNMFADRESVPEVFSYHGWSILGARYLTDLWDFDTKSLGSYGGPVLILHGDDDPLVAPSYSESIAAVYRNAEFCMISGGRHGFKKGAFSQALEKILRFLEKHGF